MVNQIGFRIALEIAKLQFAQQSLSLLDRTAGGDINLGPWRYLIRMYGLNTGAMRSFMLGVAKTS